MKRWAAVLCVVLLALAGCDGGGGESPAAPDLTGCWEVNERPLCTSDLHSHAELDDLELGRVGTDPWRIRQTGGDLEITDLESDLEFSGTLSGSRVRYGHREIVPDFEAEFEVELEGEGVVESGGVVAVTETYAFSSEGETLEVVCELRLERMIGAPAGCIADPDGAEGDT